MKKKTIIGILLIGFLLVGLLWPAFQIATPDYYGRIVCVSTVKRSLEEQTKPLEDLTSIMYLKEQIEIAKENVLPEPTRKRNVVIFNKDYLKKDSRDWILIVLGKDMESFIHGDLILTKNLEKKQVRNAKKMINNQEGLIYYYLYLRGGRSEDGLYPNSSEPNEIDSNKN
jgi:hypothetical protein